MKKQKICIIGGGLTGLVTAVSLSKLNCEIDLITNSTIKNTKSNRTVAISENNLDFLCKLNISKSFKKKLWACSAMKLYAENKNGKFSEIFNLNSDNKKRKIFYMIKNSIITKLILNKIKKIKSISVKSNGRICAINTSGFLKSVKFNNNNFKYNLIIICTGNNSSLVSNLFKDQIIENSYKESSITTIINHSSIENKVARQIFLNNEILALLPISNTKTSIVWTIKNNIKRDRDLILKKKIKFYTEKYLKKITFENKIEYKDLFFLIRSKYYQDRILLFGDALHVVHPLVGQGFNMTIRDLACLEKILSNKIRLGLDIGSSDILSEFSDKTKPRNFVFSIGVDFLKNAFAYKKFRNKILKVLNKSNFAKDFFFNIADKGFRF